MKNYNLIKRLFMDSHEKQTPQRFVRYAAMLIMLLTLGVGQMDSATRRYYCKCTQSWWTTSSAAIACYAWNDSGNNGWPGKKMTATGTSGEWYIDLDTKYTKVVFTRVNSAGDTYWSAKTGDLTLDENNYYTITSSSGVWDPSTVAGSWSKYAPTPAIAGSMNSWKPDANVFSGTSGSVTCSITLSANTVYEFKVITETSYYGYGSTTGDLTYVGQSGSTTLTTSGQNIRLATAGAGTYVFTWNCTSHTLSVAYPTVTHPSSDYVYFKNTGNWANVKAHVFTGGTAVDVWPGPQISSFNFDGTNYYYAALGGKTSIIFSKSGDTSTKTGDLTTASSNKGKYYDYSSSSWKSFTATLSLDHQGPTNTPAPNSITVTYGASTNLTGDVITTSPAKTGYTFGGYYTSAGGGGSQLIGTNENVVASVSDYTDASKNWIRTGSSVSSTIYAKWTQSVTLDEQGATTSGTTSKSVTYNSSNGLTTIISVPSKTGYDFNGYYTDIAGGGSKLIGNTGFWQASVSGYTDASKKWIKPSGATTIYAYWSQSVTLNANTSYHGSGANKTATAVWNGTALSSFTVTAAASGYEVEGYYTNATSGTKVLNADGTFAADNVTSYITSGKWTKAGATTLYAHMRAKTYTVTLDKNEGDTDGSVKTTYNANTTSNFNAAGRAGYSCDGYFTATEDGTKIINADGTLVDATVSNWLSSGYWVKDAADITLYAQWTENLSNYTVTYGVKAAQLSLGSLSCATTTGSTPVSSGGEVVSGTNVTFTASPIAGYEVDAWYSDAACTERIEEAGYYTSTYSPTINENTTVYVTFKKKVYTITYSPSSAPTGCTYTTKPTSCTYGNTATMVITPTAGYSVSVSARDTSSNVVAISNPSTNTYTFTQPASAVTVTVTTTENKVTLSPSVSYDHGSSSYTTSADNQIGVATSSRIKCSKPNANHYTFAGWTLTNLTVTSGNAATDTVIYVKVTTAGSAISAVANYNEVLTTTWYISGDGNGTGTDLTPGSPFAGWGTSGTRMSKKSGHSTEEVYYCTITVSTVATTDDHFPFKVYNSSGSQYYGNNGYWVTKENNHPTLSSSSGSNMKFRPYVTGTYEFKVDNTGANPVLTVTWPVFNQVRISAASPSDATNVGNFDLSDPVSNVRSVKRSLNANTTYTFKIMYNSDWYGYNSGTFTRSTSTSSNSRTISTSGGNMTLTTDYAGDYTFKFNESTKALSVDFPAAYKITFGKGSVDGTTGSFSAVDLDNGSSAVTSNSTWVKSGHDVKITAPSAKSGYRFLGWYDNNSATGDAIETNANCTISVTAATTIYACYAENLTSITVSAGTGGTVTTGSGTSNLGVTTTKAINASANPGYTWSTWTISGTAALGTTATTASNTAKGNGTNGSTGTITATFTPNPYTITLEKHNGQSDGSINVTFDANTNLTGTAVTAPTKTGYTFGGYYTGESGAGTKIINADGTVVASASDASYTYTDASKNWKYPNNITLHAKWTAKTYTVTLDYDETNHGDITTTPPTGSVTATYDAAMPAIAILPKAAEGYAFMGYYSAAGGSGTQYYDGTGASITNWNVDDEITLYAYYKQAEITSVTFDDDVVEPGATVTATANIDPTPAGTTIVCWRLLHDNGNEYSPQPTFTPASGTTVSFTAPETSTHYKVEAKLRTGSSCGGGTLLDTETGRFQVAGSHTVTVNYKCGDDVIKAATSVTATPLDWTEEFTAPDIFGYTFARWDAADGVTIKNGDSDPVTTTTEATIQIKATYNGKLTAVYTQKSMIFFKNTLGWSDVYVNFYTGSYWNNPKGSGNQSVTKRNLAMTQYGETDIWYYDYGAASITPSLYVSFTSESQDNTEFFWKAGGVNVVYPANYPDAINTDKSSENGFKAATPMFVPLATQDGVTLNQSSGGKADYYNAGYWTKYTPGTGYTLEIYNEAGNVKLKSVEFTSADELMPMKATVDLEGGTTYKFQLKRSGDIYYGNSGTMTYANHGSPTPWDMTNGSFSMCGIITNAAGDYTFNLSYSGNSSTPPHYRLRMAVDYPIADGDYRLIYKDAVHTLWHPSAIVSKGNNRKDTVSFFVRPGSSPEMKIQTASVNPSTGAVTWGSDVAIPTATLTGLTSTDVYNFNLSMDGSGNISLESVDTYTGNFYIRTDAANSKWDNYRNDPDHLMVYSEYSIEHGGYTHYHAHWVNKDDAGRKNVKFTIANDYSPCISDTLTRETAEGTWANIDDFMTTGGDLKRSANVRFMWDKRDNSISRAYVDGAQGDWSTNFLYMLNVEAGADKIRKSDESALTDHKVTFKDNGNWMYEANIQAQPTAQIKLLSNWGESPTITQYFRGASDATETLIGGSGSNWYDIRLIYDFKTNRLIAGLIPSGTIDEQMAIHADVMFIREHQGDIAQLTFAEKEGKMGAITDIETAYGVLRLNKWTLNNKSKADGHAPLSPLLSRYERDLFYISFPFKVAMEDVFGFGTYGQHWIIEYYDGANRAANGYWQESDPNWKFIWDRKGKFFEPGQGYIIALELDELGESSSVWTNTDQVELYFPSYGSMSNITSSTATYEIPAHECTIDRSKESNGHGGTLGDAYDRRVKDSHWNVLGVPTYVNPDAPSFANTDWITTADTLHIGPNFLYEWNPDDNSVTAVSGTGYSYHAMHAYLVQYCGDVTWTSSVSVKPSAPAARRNPAYRGEYEFRIELQQETQAVDQTYVKLSDDERVTTGFEFNYDLSKEFNKKKANIYTLIGTEQVAGNVLPLTEQTTVVPVGVQIKTNGEYTFSMPEGTAGIGVTLIDNETGLRTPLGLTDYTVTLEAGTYEDRFALEISPVKGTATGVEEVTGDGLQVGARKVMIDGILYIVKDGKVFDAHGNRVR